MYSKFSWTRLAQFCLLFLVQCCFGNFRNKDRVSMSFRSQYAGLRTHWFDQHGYHTPVFNYDNGALVVLNQPKLNSTKEMTDYKIQFSFNGDRLVTEWLTLYKTKVPITVHNIPVVEIMLTSSGRELRRVHAQIKHMTKEQQSSRQRYVYEFTNNLWPKHLLVKYRWEQEQEVGVVKGMAVIMGTALLVFFLSFAMVIVKHKTAFTRSYEVSKPQTRVQYPSSSAGSYDVSSGVSQGYNMAGGAQPRYPGGRYKQAD